MSTQFQISAQLRAGRGTADNRRDRHQGKVPAVIYGAGKDNMALLLDHNEMIHNLGTEAFHSAIIEIKTDSGVEQAILRDVQMHPYQAKVMHVDFQRISATEKLRMEIPVHFMGESEAPGVRLGGGIMSHLVNEVEIECLPADLPEYLEVDVSQLEMHDSVKLTDIKVPEGVTIVTLAHGGEDQTLAAVMPPQADVVEEEEEEGVAEVEEAAAEAPEPEESPEE